LNAQSPIPPGAKLETIATGLLQPEGPIWVDGLGLLFSDIRGNKIYKWTQENNKQIYLDPSNTSNGLTLDQEGRLILTQMGLRRVSRQERNGDITPLASTYLGKPFNSPNDVVVGPDGSIYFTDPDFNIPAGGTKEIIINGKYIKGVYRIKPNGEIQLFDGGFNGPNGICFSADKKKFFVNDGTGIYAWDLINDSTMANKRLFFTVPVPNGGYLDGMKADSSGNIYCTGTSGVWIISADGKKVLDRIALPNNEAGSNVAWGDSDRKTLYITSGTGTSVYRIRLAATTGVDTREGNIAPATFELSQNYPNPFNPTTQIRWELAKGSYVKLKVYNSLGSEVATLADEYKPKGVYYSSFPPLSGSKDSLQLASGIYFCRLTADNFSQIRKMVLLK
jgi:gluconolactonase